MRRRGTQLTNETYFQTDDYQVSKEIPENWDEEMMTCGRRDSGCELAPDETGPAQNPGEMTWEKCVPKT